MVWQFRAAAGKVVRELPAGIVEGSSIKGAVIAEAEEECGVKLRSPKSLGKIYPSIGRMNEAVHLFYEEVDIDEERLQHLLATENPPPARFRDGYLSVVCRVVHHRVPVSCAIHITLVEVNQP